MALHKRKPKNTESSSYDKLITQLSEQTKQLSELNKRMDSLIESDKAVHEAISKGTKEATEKKEPEKKEPEIKTEEPDTTDKAEEQAEKIENA